MKRLIAIQAIMLALAPALAAETVDLQGTTFKVDTIRHYNIADGLSHTHLNLTAGARKIQAYVIDYDKTAGTNVTPHVLIGRDSCNTAETVSSMAARHSTDSRRPLAGINGDFFITSSFAAQHEFGNAILGYPNMSCFIDGKIVAPDIIDKASRENALIIGKDNWYIDATDLKYRVLNNDGSTIVDATAVNFPRRDNEMVVYNSYMGKYTKTAAGGREICLKPAEGSTWSVNKSIKFVVSGSWSTSGSMAIPADGIVISCGAQYSNTFIDNLKDGDIVKLKIVMSLPAHDAIKPSDISDVIGGDVRILNQGVTTTEAIRWINTPSAQYSRSLVGFDRERQHMYICAVDAGYAGSSGVSYYEAADLMRHIGCWDALDLDGGGSTEMWTAHAGVINHLRDGSERAVGNALYFMIDAPADKEVTSIQFADHRITLPRYGLYTPVIHGFNRYGQLVDTDYKAYRLEAEATLGTITADGLSLLADGNGAHLLKAVMDDGTVATIAVTIDNSSPVELGATQIICDPYHSWSAPITADVAGTPMPVAPQAFTWTSDDTSVATVDGLGRVTGIKDGTATITGTNAAGTLSYKACVQCPKDKTAPLDDADIDFSTWKISVSGLSQQLTPTGADSGFGLDINVRSTRGARVSLYKDIMLWGLPDAIEIDINPGTAKISKLTLNALAASASRAVAVNFESPEAGKTTTLRIPVETFGSPDDVTTYPICFKSLFIYPSATGQQHIDIPAMRLVYDKYVNSVDDIAADRNVPLTVTVSADRITLNIQADRIDLYDLTGHRIGSVTGSSSIARPTTGGIYILQAVTASGTATAKVAL